MVFDCFNQSLHAKQRDFSSFPTVGIPLFCFGLSAPDKPSNRPRVCISIDSSCTVNVYKIVAKLLHSKIHTANLRSKCVIQLTKKGLD